MSEVEVVKELTVDGTAVTMEEILKRVSSGTRIDEVTIGRKEVRPKVQYQNNEYFLSIKLNFSKQWDLYHQLDELSEEDDKKIRTAIKKEIHSQIMQKETYISGVILHWEMKDGVTIWPRDPNNPAVGAETAGEAYKAVHGGKE